MKRVFIDMDNVLVDFQSGLDQVSEEVKAEYAGRLDEIPGLFGKMKPMEGAIEAVQKIGTDCDEMKQLEKANMRFVVSVANQYQKRGLTLDELIEAGLEGLRKGAMKYNFEADFKFIAFAVWWIRQSILQALEKNNNE